MERLPTAGRIHFNASALPRGGHVRGRSDKREATTNPPTPARLAEALPDAPRFVEIRAMLRAGTCDVYGDPHAYLARSRIVPLGSAIGTPDGDLLRRVLRGAPPGFELLVPPENVGHVRAALRDWRARPATMRRTKT